jgi:hypothetical protein
MMFNENGVAYAPWMNKQIDEEVSTTHNYRQIGTDSIDLYVYKYAKWHSTRRQPGKQATRQPEA